MGVYTLHHPHPIGYESGSKVITCFQGFPKQICFYFILLRCDRHFYHSYGYLLLINASVEFGRSFYLDDYLAAISSLPRSTYDSTFKFDINLVLEQDVSMKSLCLFWSCTFFSNNCSMDQVFCWCQRGCWRWSRCVEINGDCDRSFSEKRRGVNCRRSN
jgi:hypothetical protein